VERGRPALDLALLDALPHLAWVADPAGDVWYLNALARTYTGRNLDWVRAHGWEALVHPDDVEVATAAWLGSAVHGEAYEVEFRVRRHDGAYRWHLERTAHLHDADGALTAWIATSTDVHARHVADDELARARRRADEQLALLDVLLDHAPIGMGFLDRDLRLVIANQALAGFAGQPLEAFVDRPLAELAPDQWNDLRRILERVVGHGETVTDIPVSAPDARDPERTRHWSIGYYPVELAGEVLGAGVLQLDQTEQLERIAKLQSSEELRALAERAGALGSWEIDVVSGTTWWSAGLRALVGVGPDVPAAPERFAALLHPSDRDRFERDLAELLETGGPRTLRYRLVPPDADERVLEVRVASEIVGDRVVRLVGTTQDVTERVRRSEQIERSEQLLSEAETLAQLGSFETILPSGETYFSPGLRRLLGYGSDAATPREVWERYIHPADRERQTAMMRTLLVTGEMDATQLRIVTEDGSERVIEIRGSTYRDAAGEPHRLIGTVLDVTERERWRTERLTLLEQSISAREHERGRIAEHLHDDAVQALTATLLRVDHAIATGSTATLGRARATLEAAVRSLRLHIMELAPVDLTTDGLEVVVAAYAEHLLEADGVEVQLEVALADEHGMPADHLLATYQIIREALANVREHAAASRVTVTVRRDGGAIVGVVADDGVGPGEAVAPRPGHLGTRLMRQRADLAGGEVTIRPGPDGAGTTVAWRLPLGG
jgi:PAS domain S-box-containing protein